MSKDPRPRNEGGTPFSTRMSLALAELLGYDHYEGVGFTQGETKALARLYGIDLSQDRGKLLNAGDRLSVHRLALIDGLRVMALLGKYLEDEEDPVQLVAQGLSSLGLDVELEESDE